MVNQFLRLEKIEFSGSRGQMLSDLVDEMFTQFTEKSAQFQGLAKGPLNISNTVSLTYTYIHVHGMMPSLKNTHSGIDMYMYMYNVYTYTYIYNVHYSIMSNS